MTDLKQAFAGRRVLVTGHTGFKGSWLAYWLHRLGAEVTGFALAPAYERSHFERLGLDRKFVHMEGDLRDPAAILDTVRSAQPEFVFHLAAQALVRRSYADPKETFDTNVGGAVNLLEALRLTGGVETLVFCTSDKCYLNVGRAEGYAETDTLGGHDPYSGSKAAAEMVFHAYDHSFLAPAGIAAASVRAGNVVGGGDWAEDRILPDCIRALEAGRDIVLRNPDATRPWQHVLDPLNGYMNLALALRDNPGAFRGGWNFGPEAAAPMTVMEVAERAIAAWGSGAVRVERPADAPPEHHLLQLDIAKATQALGWRPRWSMSRAVDESVAWYKAVTEGADAAEMTAEQIAAFMENDDD